MSRSKGGNEAGSAEDRRRRRQWIMENFAADMSKVTITVDEDGRPGHSGDRGPWVEYTRGPESLVQLQASWGRSCVVEPCVRCYRCGRLLTIETLTVDRIIPFCRGGTYRRNNIRPACSRCQSITGNHEKAKLRAARS